MLSRIHRSSFYSAWRQRGFTWGWWTIAQLLSSIAFPLGGVAYSGYILLPYVRAGTYSEGFLQEHISTILILLACVFVAALFGILILLGVFA